MNPKILIVDDDQGNLKQITTYLKHHKLCNIKTAASKDEAQITAKQEHFDVIISDMVMESEDAGYDLVEVYKNLSPLVIVITAFPNTGLLKKCMRAGAFDYIDKSEPDAYKQMVDSIKEGLRDLKNKNKKIDRNALYIQNNFDKLSEKYPGSYVAVLDEVVVASDNDYGELEKKINKQFPHVHVAIVSIPTKELIID